MIIGLGFSIPRIVYENENIPLIYQTIIQMESGFLVLFLVAIYLEWIPINLGIIPIILWIINALIFGFIDWAGFYLYYRNEAKKFNERLKEIKS
ncbi:MAG: DUF3021 domain-containing protein [Methanobacteriaceae archaeon]|jgi:hypothetical protein|nr:DUF3021 domain-containing protein [Methanobacteriaceae archaeon]